MKRRTSSRRQVLDLDTNTKSSSPKRAWHTKYQQICLDHKESQNGSSLQEENTKKNALQGLVGSYNSDSEEDTGKKGSGDLDAKVENFLKEISEIAPTPVETKNEPAVVVSKPKKTSITTAVASTISAVDMSQTVEYADQTYSAPYSAWQECYDESTGCCYYWNVETNAVTWEIPPEVQAYKAALEQWKAQQMLIGHGYMPQVVAPNAAVVVQPQQESVADNHSKRKVKKGRNSDSEDDKIEMITSYGPTSGESESEEEISTKPPLAKKKKIHQAPEHIEGSVNGEDKVGPKLPDYVLEDSNSSSALQSLVSYGPDPGPPGAEDHDEDFNSYYRHSLLSNVPDTGPPGEDSDNSQVENNDMERSKSSAHTEEKVNGNREEMIIIDTENNDEKKSALIRLKSLKKKGSNSSGSQPSSSEGEHEETDEEVDENCILDRLRSQARVLQDLGGEIPDEIKDLIEPTKEPANVEEIKDLASTSFSLIAGYGDDSEPEDEPKSEEQIKDVKPLFPIVGADAKEKSNSTNLKVIKLSARAKALIKASTTTGKARATDFVSTSEGLKPADAMTAADKEPEVPSKASAATTILDPTINQKTLARKKRLGVKTSVVKSEALLTSPKPDVLTTEVKKPLGVKTSVVVKSEAPLASPKPDVMTTLTTEVNVQSKPSTSLGYSTAWSYSSELSSGERKGFGFSAEGQATKCESKRTPIRFIKAETLMPAKVETKPIESDKELVKKESQPEKSSDEEVLQLSQIISEKVKFLGEGKDAVPPVQSMAIQLETLVSAWEAGGLSLQYMSSWLMSMDAQLAGLEQAAAPKGWLCEWNRSYKRYFYRNKKNGAIQWEYPVTEEEEIIAPAEPIGGGEEAMELCDTPPPVPLPPPSPATPPPPSISSPRSVSPPPPPRISKEPSSPEAELEIKGKDDLPPPPPVLPPVVKTNPPLPPLPPPPPPLPPDTPPPLPPDSPPPPPSYSNEPLPPGVDQPEDYYHARPPLPPAPPPPPPPPQSPPPAPPAEKVDTYTMGYAVAAPGPMLYDPYHMHTAADYTSQYGASAMYSAAQESYVIARPPANTLPVNLATELNSFYNDIAALEPTPPPKPPTPEPVAASPSPPPRLDTPPPPPEVVKKKKKTKVAPGLSLKKKGVSSLVAKWQQVQQDARKESSEDT